MLTDFFNIDELLNRVEYVLDNQEKAKYLRENARTTIIERYDLKKLLPRHIEIIKSTAKAGVGIT